jgi:hypothetical protein
MRSNPLPAQVYVCRDSNCGEYKANIFPQGCVISPHTIIAMQMLHPLRGYRIFGVYRTALSEFWSVHQNHFYSSIKLVSVADCLGKSIMATSAKSSTRYSEIYAPAEKRPLPNKKLQVLGAFKRYRSLIWMILSWLSGIAFAIGHHFFYARFHNNRVDHISISQGWIIRIGTGMAFFVQTLFVVSASIACSQQQWLTTRSKPFTVRQIDTLFSVLGNALAFLESRVWLRYPILSFLAAVAWYDE